MEPAPTDLYLLDEDHSHLERIVLPVVSRVQLEIAALIFGDELESVVQRNVHVWRHRPLRGYEP